MKRLVAYSVISISCIMLYQTLYTMYDETSPHIHHLLNPSNNPNNHTKQQTQPDTVDTLPHNKKAQLLICLHCGRKIIRKKDRTQHKHCSDFNF